MISKIGKGQEFRSVVNYILEKGKETEILDSDGVMLYSPDSIIRTFNFQTELYPRLSKPVGHISLNFSVQDKEKLSNELMVQITHDYMSRMGISETQYLIGRHYDKEHPHLHLIFNRVNNSGRTISDRFDHTRSEKNMHKELTLEYRLYFASGKEKVNEHRLWEPDKTKYEIYDCLKAIIPQSQNWDQLICALQEQNIGVAFLISKRKLIKFRGLSSNKNGYFFSGSKVDRQFSYYRIDRQLKLGEQK